MRFYFFKSEIIDRGNGPVNTLRALPGQTFPDGRPVDTTLDVQSPDEADSSPNGARFQYPIGTVFCSSFLDSVVTSQNNVIFTVYDQSKNQSAAKGAQAPDFHPVSDDPNFNYIDPAHRNPAMCAAYIKFLTFGEQETGLTGEEDAASAKIKKKSAVKYFSGPADRKGKANSPEPGWTQQYEDQLAGESDLIVMWMKLLLNRLNVTSPARRPKNDPSITNKINVLYTCGESIDTITSRRRFEKMMNDQKIDLQGLANISVGPLCWYIDQLIDEHDKNADCTAVQRSATSGEEVSDAAFIVNTAMNQRNATSNPHDGTNTLRDMAKAISDGWRIEDMLNPEVMDKAQSIQELTSKIATGTIPAPVHAAADGNSLIDQLMKKACNRKPADKDGFHIDELTWQILVRNLNRHKNTLIAGPTGTGKTEIIKRLCEQTGTPLTIVPMGGITDPVVHLVGKMDFETAQTTKFDWAEFALAIQRPGVVLLDELNRCPRNGTNILFSVLDGTRTLNAAGAKSTDQRNIKVNPECTFFATANIGYEYTDTKEIDQALLNRFFPIRLDYLDVKTETGLLAVRTGIEKEAAQAIALVANAIRESYRSGMLEHSVSTRETLECAEMARDGFELQDSIESTFLTLFDDGTKDPNGEYGKVKAIIASQFKK